MPGTREGVVGGGDHGGGKGEMVRRPERLPLAGCQRGQGQGTQLIPPPWPTHMNTLAAQVYLCLSRITKDNYTMGKTFYLAMSEFVLFLELVFLGTPILRYAGHWKLSEKKPLSEQNNIIRITCLGIWACHNMSEI
jgi:hypothetical protein